MNYITLKEAAKATGLNEMTIRRLCKKPESKPYIRLKEGKNGSLYTIQTNFLFDKYPPKKIVGDRLQTSIDTPINEESIQGSQVYTSVLAVKDELIQVLKDEIAYLREENKGLREENKELKLLPAPQTVMQGGNNDTRKTFWQRIWGK